VRKIVGMSFAPLLLAVVGDLPILRICFELPSVIVGAAPALALWSAADGLLWTVGRAKKSTLAVETAAVLGHDDSSKISQDESLRNNQNGKRRANCRNLFRVRTASLPAGSGGSLAPTNTGQNGSVFHWRDFTITAVGELTGKSVE
jgi:hypothetical protein